MSAASEPRVTQPVEPAPRGRNPFDHSGVQRDTDGRAFYKDSPDSLVQMLRASVERDRDARVGPPEQVAGKHGERREQLPAVAGLAHCSSLLGSLAA